MKLLALILSTSMVGCATVGGGNIARFSNSSVSQQQYLQDRYQCIQEAQRRVSGAVVNNYAGAASSNLVVSYSMYTACMGARGYQLDANGAFGPPPGGLVQMVQ